MEKKLEKQQALSSQLITIMRREIDELRDHTLSLGRKTPVEKVATFLINRYQKLELSGTTDVTISLPMSRSDIADYLGLTIETVSRTISRLRNDGILLVPSVQSVVVKDMTGLSRLAALNS
jgi:CRP/FNR family transcriptional regulator